MALGSCFCGNIRVEYTGQPITTALCHCADCRKLTGALFTYSFVVKHADLNITGNPKVVPKTADSGSFIRNHFCPECGTPLFGYKVDADGARVDGVTVLRAGIFDDLGFINEHKPAVEIYTSGRVNWFTPIEGSVEFTEMAPRPSD